jgi:hypothetical protein
MADMKTRSTFFPFLDGAVKAIPAWKYSEIYFIMIMTVFQVVLCIMNKQKNNVLDWTADILTKAILQISAVPLQKTTEKRNNTKVI